MGQKIEFKSWKDAKWIDWEYGRSQDFPIGQKWGCSDAYFVTNRKGEGFKIHGGTSIDEIVKMIDALNKRDAEIANLKQKLDDINTAPTTAS